MLSVVSKPPMKNTRDSREYTHLLDELVVARQRAGLSQEELAAALGRPQSFVSKCERGERRLDVIELRHWIMALGGELVGFLSDLEERITRNALPQLPKRPKPSRKLGK